MQDDRARTNAQSMPPGPVQPGERIKVIDILRGFALFGILLVNMMYFAHPIYREVLETSWASPVDRAAGLFISLFAEGKFFTLFSLLFGLGLAIQMQRAETTGVKIVPLFVKRLLVLLVIGLAHAFLFWFGDILTYYGLLGFVLLLFRNTAPHRLLKWGVAFLLIPLVLNAGLFALMELGRTVPEGAAQIEAAFAETRAQYETAYGQALAIYSGSSFAVMIPQRIADWVFATIGVTLGGMLFVVMTMFLVGLYVGKRRLLHDAGANLPLWRKVFVRGAVLGLIGNLLYVTLAGAGDPLEPSLASLLGLVGFLIGAPALSLCYASGLVLLAQSERWHARLAPLAAVGRTALSNYLLQTLIATTIFYGYGLGLYGRIGPALGILLTLAIFGLQIPLSNLWASAFASGPPSGFGARLPTASCSLIIRRSAIAVENG